MADSVHEKLAEWLATTARCLPGVNGPELKELVHYLYTPEEAQLALQLKREECTLDALVIKTGMEKEALESLIKSMEMKGTIYTEPCTDNPKYHAFGVEAPGLVETAAGWVVDTNTPFGKKALELLGKFKTIYVKEGVSKLGASSSFWCAVSALPPDAKPTENIFELVKTWDGYIAVLPCPCRLMERHVEHGEVCDCVLESCVVFGELGQWAVEQGRGRHITKEELLEILKACEKKGQLLSGPPGFIMCNCCKHACLTLYALKFGQANKLVPNHFFALVDPETCTSCGVCTERCPVDAIQLETSAMIDQSKCIGCGVCATGCEENSIKMFRRPEEEIAKLDAMMMEGVGQLFSKTEFDPMVMKMVMAAVGRTKQDQGQ